MPQVRENGAADMRWGILHREFFERSKTGVGVVSELFLRVSESTSFVVASFRVVNHM